MGNYYKQYHNKQVRPDFINVLIGHFEWPLGHLRIVLSLKKAVTPAITW